MTLDYRFRDLHGKKKKCDFYLAIKLFSQIVVYSPLSKNV